MVSPPMFSLWIATPARDGNVPAGTLRPFSVAGQPRLIVAVSHGLLLVDPERAMQARHFDGVVHDSCAHDVAAGRKVSDRHVRRDDTVGRVQRIVYQHRCQGQCLAGDTLGHCEVNLGSVSQHRCVAVQLRKGPHACVGHTSLNRWELQLPVSRP